jgi:hypothetical protein
MKYLSMPKKQLKLLLTKANLKFNKEDTKENLNQLILISAKNKKLNNKLLKEMDMMIDKMSFKELKKQILRSGKSLTKTLKKKSCLMR